MNRACNKDPNLFCYICGLFTPKSYSRNITQSLEDAYHDRFSVPIQDQEKRWAPHVSCQRCYQALLQNKCLPFNFPMVWFEPVGHHECYFCLTSVTGFTVKTREKINYAKVTSVQNPIIDINPVVINHQPTSSISNSNSSSNDDNDSEEYFPPACNNDKISQSQLDALIKEFGLSKFDSQKMGKILQSFNVLESDTTYSHYRNRDIRYAKYFSVDGVTVYCHDIKGLLIELKFDNDINNWWIFIDSSTTSLKTVLLHKLCDHPSIPIAYARDMPETYESIKKTLELIKYADLQIHVGGDLKMIGFLMGLQKGYTKHMCFLCLWDSRDKSNQYTHASWPLRKENIVGQHNISHPPLIPTDKILLPPLHIKLGLFKQFVKSLSSLEAKQFISNLFPKLSEAKLSEGIFVGPQLRQLMKKGENFAALLNTREKNAWDALVAVTKGFLGKNRASEYRLLIRNLMKTFDRQHVRMSLKVHFLKDHLDFFHSDFGKVTDEHGERFHQTISTIEKRYCGRADARMMGDFCWLLK